MRGPIAKRTLEEIKHKWKDLLSRARKKGNYSRKYSYTGGAQMYPKGPYTDLVFDVIGPPAPVLDI